MKVIKLRNIRPKHEKKPNGDDDSPFRKTCARTHPWPPPWCVSARNTPRKIPRTHPDRRETCLYSRARTWSLPSGVKRMRCCHLLTEKARRVKVRTRGDVTDAAEPYKDKHPYAYAQSARGPSGTPGSGRNTHALSNTSFVVKMWRRPGWRWDPAAHEHARTHRRVGSEARLHQICVWRPLSVRVWLPIPMRNFAHHTKNRG